MKGEIAMKNVSRMRKSGLLDGIAPQRMEDGIRLMSEIRGLGHQQNPYF